MMTTRTQGGVVLVDCRDTYNFRSANRTALLTTSEYVRLLGVPVRL